jgi:hypothetical protein
VGQPVQAEPGEADLGSRLVGAAGPHVPYLRPAAHQDVQVTVDSDDLHQGCGAKRAKQFPGAEPPPASPSPFTAPPVVAGTQYPGPHRGLQPQLLAPEVPGRVTAGPGPVQAAGHVAQCGQISLEIAVVGGAGRGDRVSGGPPPLAPGEHQPGPAGPQGGPLRERCQFGAVRGGLCP